MKHLLRLLAVVTLLSAVLVVVSGEAAARPAEDVGGAQLVSAAAVVPGAVSAAEAGAAAAREWSWPLRPQPTVLARFDPPEQVWSAGHRGVDLAATVGQDVLAPSVGVVSFAGSIAGRGVVVVAHPSGLRSTLEPVDGTVPVGSQVAGGQSVGTVSGGPGHCRPATCIHWGVLRGSVYLDPLAFVGASRVVLLPLAQP